MESVPGGGGESSFCPHGSGMRFPDTDCVGHQLVSPIFETCLSKSSGLHHGLRTAPTSLVMLFTNQEEMPVVESALESIEACILLGPSATGCRNDPTSEEGPHPKVTPRPAERSNPSKPSEYSSRREDVICCSSNGVQSPVVTSIGSKHK